MSKVTLNVMSKCCGNCVYWCGDRELNPLSRYIVVEVGAKGKCSQTMGTAFANSCCNKHERHPVCK